MKRWVIAALSVAAASPAALAIASSGAVTAGSAKATLRGYQCQTALDPDARGIMIVAVMKPLAHTKRMGVRFDLLYREKGGVHGTVGEYGHLGKWIYPTNPRTLGQRPDDVFTVRAPVSVLSIAPAYYRFKVSFRWTGARGKVLGTATRYSQTCFQPELRPDVMVKKINVQPDPNNANKDIYSATIRNGGASQSGPFKVQFTDGSLVLTRPVQDLAAHSGVIRRFVGPLCDPSAPPSITADPLGAVDDFNRANNTLTATCPT